MALKLRDGDAVLAVRQYNLEYAVVPGLPLGECQVNRKWVSWKAT
jgi:hypothetical protein